MKFIHAADIHLDSPLAGLARRADVPSHVTKDCTRRALANLIDLAIAEDVAFVIIAGDLYDADWKDYGTGLFFAQQMARLAPRRCILLRGNHDAASVITRKLRPPPNVLEFSSRAAHSIPLPGYDVALHGRSFPARAVPEDFSATYPAPVSGMLNIGVLHTSAEDPGAHDTYAPCGIAALRAKGYDYWALGHIHQRAELSRAPDPWIVFPGNIQGRHPNETGAKGCTLVEVHDRRIVSVDHRTLDVLRWARPIAALDGVTDIQGLADAVRDALAAEIGHADGNPVIARLTLTGTTPLHAQIHADPDAIDAECRNAATAVGDDLYLESVRFNTKSPEDFRAGADAMAQLQAAFSAALDDPALSARLLADFNALGNQIPRAARPAEAMLPRDESQLRDLLPDAWEMVAHALAGEASG
jgi:DNA repair exonuclease SbcCD nuclease subunit